MLFAPASRSAPAACPIRCRRRLAHTITILAVLAARRLADTDHDDQEARSTSTNAPGVVRSHGSVQTVSHLQRSPRADDTVNAQMSVPRRLVPGITAEIQKASRDSQHTMTGQYNKALLLPASRGVNMASPAHADGTIPASAFGDDARGPRSRATSRRWATVVPWFDAPLPPSRRTSVMPG